MKWPSWMLLLLLFVTVQAHALSWHYLSPHRVHEMIREGSALWIVDVRNPATFEHGHIEGAVNIPVAQLSVKNLSRNKPIVLADDSIGLRHARAGAEILLKKGYEKVFIMEGGITAWEADALPVTGTHGEILRPVTWDELTWVTSASVPHTLYDLRDNDERSRGPVDGALLLKGKNIEERLNALSIVLTAPAGKPLLAGKLEKPIPRILILPNRNVSIDTVRKAVKGIQGDIRYLDGAYPLWAAHQKQNPLPSPEVCPTCSGGKKVSK